MTSTIILTVLLLVVIILLIYRENVHSKKRKKSISRVEEVENDSIKEIRRLKAETIRQEKLITGKESNIKLLQDRINEQERSQLEIVTLFMMFVRHWNSLAYKDLKTVKDNHKTLLLVPAKKGYSLMYKSGRSARTTTKLKFEIPVTTLNKHNVKLEKDDNNLLALLEVLAEDPTRNIERALNQIR